MAFYIEMNLVENNEYQAIYAFGRNSYTGLIKIDKKKETISIIKDCPLDNSGKWAERAGIKLASLFRKNVYPEKTEWAS